jgi:hypothetical protein
LPEKKGRLTPWADDLRRASSAISLTVSPRLLTEHYSAGENECNLLFLFAACLAALSVIILYLPTGRLHKAFLKRNIPV